MDEADHCCGSSSPSPRPRALRVAAAGKAGLPNARLHTLRHSAASVMLTRGVPLEVVSDPRPLLDVVTRDFYGHVSPDLARQPCQPQRSLRAVTDEALPRRRWLCVTVDRRQAPFTPRSDDRVGTSACHERDEASQVRWPTNRSTRRQTGTTAQRNLGDTVRAYTSADGTAVADLVVAAGMFTREEAGFLGEGVLEADDATCFVEDADDGKGLASVLFYRPEESSDRAFDLTMIAVRPDLQGGGRGAALMRHAEHDLRHRGQRLLIVRTSGTAQYDKTRNFYRGLGYAEQSRVPDYWTDGDDLVIFTKRLAG